jgi:hypothetical protein
VEKMNEKIKKLAEQSGVVMRGKFGKPMNIDELEKFAELIVRECGVALNPMLRNMVSRGQAFDLIKRHFGVEE